MIQEVIFHLVDFSASLHPPDVFMEAVECIG
jgi:hypothetical protein